MYDADFQSRSEANEVLQAMRELVSASGTVETHLVYNALAK
jgi:hypothetical protein